VNVYNSLLQLSVGNDSHKHVTDCDSDAATCEKPNEVNCNTS
jgi:hypothetical protein